MNRYFRKSEVQAKGMTRGEYNTFRGWELPKDEDGTDAGYLIVDLNTPPNVSLNHPDYDGHVSWVPEKVFENTFFPALDDSTHFNYGVALEYLKAGKKVARKGWNGNGMFIYYVPAAKYPVNRNKNKTMLEYADSEGLIQYQPYLALKTIDGSISTWVASISDTFAEDFYVVE